MQINFMVTNPFNFSLIFAILFEDAQYVHYTLPVVHRRKSHADVVELVDTLALGASAARREGSSPFIRTKVKDQANTRSFTLVEFYELARTHFEREG